MITQPAFEKFETPQPFIKWVGGKRRQLSVIESLMPESINQYYEPFLGGGAVLFGIAHRVRGWCYIGDTNEKLINAYAMVKYNPEQLIHHLSKHCARNSKSYYQKVKAIFNVRPLDPIEQAAAFIYLCRAGWVGMWCEDAYGNCINRYGCHDIIPVRAANIMRCSAALEKTVLCQGGFEYRTIDPGSVVYCDPPYDGTKTPYQSDFTEGDQVALAGRVARWGKHSLVIVSNSDTPLIRDLYQGFEIHEIQAPRGIRRKGYTGSGKVRELLIVARPFA